MIDMMKNENIVIKEEKNIKDTKLILKNVNVDTDTYEAKILMEENIENIYKFQIVYDSECRSVVYDVTDTISFEEYLKSNRLCKDDICELIISIDEILTSLENYLVSENSVALDLRLIRVVKNDDELKFKYVAIPNYCADFSYELSKLLIRVLRYIDIADKEALNIAYGLFVRSSKENYTMNDLLSLVEGVKKRSSKELYDYDMEALHEYDEMLACEMTEELLKEEVSDEIIEDNKEELFNKELLIDDDTNDYLNDELYKEFDKDDKKILKFNKRAERKKKRALNAHINLNFLCYIIMPIVLAIIPVLYYLINGKVALLNNLFIIVFYELIGMIVLVAGRIINAKVKRI